MTGTVMKKRKEVSQTMSNIQLTPEQEYAKDFFVQNKRCGLFLDMGLGKTAITLMGLKELGAQGWLSGHILVIAPTSVAKTSWSDEIKKWDDFKDLRYQVVVGMTKQKREQTFAELDQPTLIIINDTIVPQTIKWFIDHDVSIGALIVDESQIIKNYASKRFKSLQAVSIDIPIIALLSGTSVPNSLQDIWSQIYLLDRGQRLGKNITQFRKQFMYPVKSIQSTEVVKYHSTYEQEVEVANRISDIAIWMPNDATKLPPLYKENYYVELDDDEREAYNEIAKERCLNLAQEMVEKRQLDEKKIDDIEEDDFDEYDFFTDMLTVSAPSAAALINKLSQIANGAVLEDEDKENPRKKRLIIKMHDRKVNALMDLIYNIEGPILVVYWYRADLKLITKRLDAEGENYTVFDSKDPDVVSKWNNGDIPILLCQASKANFGLNLQGSGSNLIWFSLPFYNFSIYKQMNRRLWRKGQKQAVTIYHILAEDTVDSKMMKAIKDKNEVFMRLMDILEVMEV